MLMQQPALNQQPMMVQPVYSYMPSQPTRGGIHNKMRQTQQRVNISRRMGGPNGTIESRVLLPNQQVNQTRSKGGHR